MSRSLWGCELGSSLGQTPAGVGYIDHWGAGPTSETSSAIIVSAPSLRRVPTSAWGIRVASVLCAVIFSISANPSNTGRAAVQCTHSTNASGTTSFKVEKLIEIKSYQLWLSSISIFRPPATQLPSVRKREQKREKKYWGIFAKQWNMFKTSGVRIVGNHCRPGRIRE